MKFISPKRIPEPNIQAEIYHRLKLKGIECMLEMHLYCEKYGGELTPDILIISKEQIVGIIEVKSLIGDKRLSNREIFPDMQISSKQLKRYLLYGLPLFYCTNWEGIEKAIEFAEGLVQGQK